MIEAIKNLLKKGDPIIVAIDGNSAAGKSALGEKLLTLFDANLFHMDDFFLPIERKTHERLAVPGNNVDRERFLREVLMPLKSGLPFAYRPFDCQTQALLEVKVTPKRLSIVEGVYSLHPTLRPYYDLTVFMKLEKKEQERRILLRNGEAVLQRFLAEWIPLENRYFAYFETEEKCDIVL